MPQLNPSPWLMIFFMIWTIVMFIFLNKVLNPTHHNLPTTKQMKELTLPTWNWPWY